MDARIQKLARIFILCLAIILGFVLRSFNLNMPPIGYHNMKENEYLSMAQDLSMGSGADMGSAYLSGAFGRGSDARLHYRSAILPYQIILSRKILGENIRAPRLVNVLFGICSIAVIYHIALLLFNNAFLSLLCAFLLSIMPLGVFFSRNIQTESPALFFMLLGNLFYLRFASSLKRYNLLFGGMLFYFAWIYECRFIIGLLPFAFCFPFKSLWKDKKDLFKFLLALLSPFLVMACGIAVLKRSSPWPWWLGAPEGVRIWEIFTYNYWSSYGKTILWYAAGENFTYVYLLLAALGIAVALFIKKSLLDRYIIGWSAAIVAYGAIFSDFITQHGYSQMPFLPLVCVSTAYAILYISQKLVIKNISGGYLILLLSVAVVSLSTPFVSSAILRMYSTVYLGLDVAGESLREFTNKDERIFLSTHAQGESIARYAGRRMGWADSAEDFKDKEKKFNIRYVCFYPAEFALALKSNKPELFEHIQNNYHVKEVGLTEGQEQLYYIILEKGRSLHPESFLQSFSGPRQVRTVYKMFGKNRFFYSLRPPAESEAVYQ